MSRLILVVSLLVAVAFPFTITVAGASEAPRHETPIKKLRVIVRTGEDFGASTTDTVFFSLGPAYEWTLEADADTFHAGHSATFNLPGNGLNLEDIKYIKLRKTPGGDDWQLEGIEVWVNGRPIYRNGDIHLWLDSDHKDWTAPDYPRT
jgi:hypothetical protein